MKLNFRQGIVRSLADANGVAAFLESFQSNVNIITEGKPVIVTAAYQDSDYLIQIPQDVQNAWGPFTWNVMWGPQPSSPNYFMYWDVNLATGVVTRGYTGRQPISSQFAPVQPADDQHWFDLTTNIMKFWNGLQWVPVIRVFAGCMSTAQGLITYSYGSQVGLTYQDYVIDAGYILYGPDQKAVKSSIGKILSSVSDMSLYIGNYTSPVKLETLSTDAVATEQIPAYYAVTIVGPAEIALAQPNDDQKRTIGLAASDCIVGQSTKIITAGVVYNDQWTWDIAQGKDLYLGVNGTLLQSTGLFAGSSQRVATILDERTVIIDIDTYQTSSGDGTVIANSSLLRVVASASATYNLQAADLTGITWLRMSSASANSVVLSDIVNGASEIGSTIRIRQVGAGTTTIATTSQTINLVPSSVLASSGQYTTFTLVKVADSTWDVVRDGSAVTTTLSALSVNDITVTPGSTVMSVLSVNDITVIPLQVSSALSINNITVVPTVADGGTTPTAGYLSTHGNQIIDSAGNNVRLKSVNWFGGEGTNFVPNGIWQVSYTSIIDDIAGMGFNCIRMPFSGDTFKAGTVALSINSSTNPDLMQSNGTTPKSQFEIFDAIINYAGTKGLKVVFDHHQQTASSQKDGQPFGGSGSTYTEQNWFDTWTAVATHYANNATVIGADVHNEPYALSWNTWATQAEACAEVIHAIAPNWLIMVEGVTQNNDNSTTWWGGALKDVATRPITLTHPNKVVYSPHEYGQSVGTQTWLATDSTTVTNYPHNLYAIWRANWGYIYENNIAPIWIGEFGGKFGVNGSGASDSTYAPNATEEIQWLNNLMAYMNGDFSGTGSSQLTGTNQGLSFSYWCYNPNSGDTGGLIQDDWVTHQPVKLNLLKAGGLITF